MSSCPAPSVPTKFSSALSSPDGDLISTGSAQRKLLGTSQSRQPCHRHLECRSRPTSRCRCALGHSKCQAARRAHRQCRRARHQHLKCRSPPAAALSRTRSARQLAARTSSAHRSSTGSVGRGFQEATILVSLKLAFKNNSTTAASCPHSAQLSINEALRATSRLCLLCASVKAL